MFYFIFKSYWLKEFENWDWAELATEKLGETSQKREPENQVLCYKHGPRLFANL